MLLYFGIRMSSLANVQNDRGASVGVMGGSFDPVHIGHLAVALDALEQCCLDQVLWIPAASAPLRGDWPRAQAVDRLAMVRLAVAGMPRFVVDDCEIERGGTSYAWETVRVLKQRHPEFQLKWIIGADQLAQINSWHRIGELARTIEFIVASRPNSPVDSPSATAALNLHFLKPRAFSISSTEIRTRIGSGLPIDPFVPAAVRDYIYEKRLYTNTDQ